MVGGVRGDETAPGWDDTPLPALLPCLPPSIPRLPPAKAPGPEGLRGRGFSPGPGEWGEPGRAPSCSRGCPGAAGREARGEPRPPSPAPASQGPAGERRSVAAGKRGGVCSAGQPRSPCLSFRFIYFLSCAYRAAPAAPRLLGPRCRRGRSGAPGKAGIPVTPTPAPTPPPAPNATESGVRLKMPLPKLEERKGLMNRRRKPEEEPPQKIGIVANAGPGDAFAFNRN